MYSTAFLDLPPLQQAGGSVQLPGSKSISNRVLLLAALSEGTTEVCDLLASDDTRVMLDALRALGCGVQGAGGGVARICTKADTYPDGRAWVGHGIQPTVKAAPTEADLRRGRHTVLAAALAALKK